MTIYGLRCIEDEAGSIKADVWVLPLNYQSFHQSHILTFDSVEKLLFCGKDFGAWAIQSEFSSERVSSESHLNI